MAVPGAMLDLVHRGVAVLDGAILPALVPDQDWRPAGEVEGWRVVAVGGGHDGERPFHLAPTDHAADAIPALVRAGAVACIYLGTCASPSQRLGPGEVLVVEAARTPEGQVAAHAALATKLLHRCERRGVPAQRGVVASDGRAAGAGELAENARVAAALRAGREAGIATAALLVCEGRARDAGGPAVLRAFDQVFGVLQEVLGADRRRTPPPEP